MAGGPPFPVVRDPAVLAGYLSDASNLRGHAEALVRPRTTEEVAEVVTWCGERGIPLTVTARRTSTTGAPVPQGGWLLSTERLQAILEVGHDLARAEAGILLGDLQDAVEGCGRLFPPDPTSRRSCSLGGAIACNASGARSFRFGPTRPWVAAVRAVLPDGRIVEADRSTPLPAGWPPPRWKPPPVKNAAGYAPADNLLDLLIGDEGTLGIVTEATVRLTDPPPHVVGVVAFLPEVARGVDLVERLRAEPEGPHRPWSIEWFDRASLRRMARREPGLPPEAACGVWFELTPDDPEAALEHAAEALEAVGALDATRVALSRADHERIARMRHALPASINEELAARGLPKVATDAAVPDAALREMMAAYEAVPEPKAVFGHVGDSHLHLNLLPRDRSELREARRIQADILRKAIALGGTVSAEHGIGKLKRPWLAAMAGPEAVAAFRALKRAADPAGILCPGNLLPEPGEAPPV